MLTKARLFFERAGYLATTYWLVTVGIPMIFSAAVTGFAWLAGLHSVLALLSVYVVGTVVIVILVAVARHRFPSLLGATVARDAPHLYVPDQILVTEAITVEKKDSVSAAIQQVLTITVEDERWINLFGRVLILEMKLRIANGPKPFQIVSYTFEGSGAYPSEGAIGEQIRNEIVERQERLGPLIGMVNPNETVSRWVVNSFAPPPPNQGGTPGFVFTIYDAAGNEHRITREPRAKLVVRSEAVPGSEISHIESDTVPAKGEPKRSKTWWVNELDVDWQTDGSRDSRGRLNVSGPFCPRPCLTELAYDDALDAFSFVTKGKVLGGQYGGYLICPSSACTKKFDWRASQTIDEQLNVEYGRDLARANLEAKIRREEAGLN